MQLSQIDCGHTRHWRLQRCLLVLRGFWRVAYSSYSRHQISSEILNCLFPSNTFLQRIYYVSQISQPAKICLKNKYFEEQIHWMTLVVVAQKRQRIIQKKKRKEKERKGKKKIIVNHMQIKVFWPLIARWRHFTTITKILQFVIFLCKFGILFF